MHDAEFGFHELIFGDFEKMAGDSYLDDFPDAVDTIGQQTLHASVVIHVVSMPDAHEKNVCREPWNSIRHGFGVHFSNQIFNNVVFVIACELNHTTNFLRFQLGGKRKQVL